MFRKNAKPAKSVPAKKSRVKEVAEQPQGYHRLEIPNSASSSATSSTLVTVMVLAAAVVLGAVVTVACFGAREFAVVLAAVAEAAGSACGPVHDRQHSCGPRIPGRGHRSGRSGSPRIAWRALPF